MILAAVRGLLAARQSGRDPPGAGSRSSTPRAQIAFAALVLGAKAFGYDAPVLVPGRRVAWLVAASTLASGGVYIANGSIT